jgi:hypothetical protein
MRPLPAVIALVIALSRVGVAQPERPLPLDPLTPAERAVADSVVRVDPRLREFMSAGPSRVIGIDFIAAKDERGADARSDLPTRRTAEALLYRYDLDQGLSALIDLERRGVIQTARIPGESVPINKDEVAAAAKLALADPRVARLFGDRMPPFRVATGPATLEETNQPRIEGLRTVGATRDDPCYRGRCVVLFFRVNNQYVQVNRVTVDLRSRRVLIQEGER